MNKQVNNLLDLLEKNLPNANAFKEKIFNKTSYYQNYMVLTLEQVNILHGITKLTPLNMHLCKVF